MYVAVRLEGTEKVAARRSTRELPNLTEESRRRLFYYDPDTGLHQRYPIASQVKRTSGPIQGRPGAAYSAQRYLPSSMSLPDLISKNVEARRAGRTSSRLESAISNRAPVGGALREYWRSIVHGGPRSLESGMGGRKPPPRLGRPLRRALSGLPSL